MRKSALRFPVTVPTIRSHQTARRAVRQNACELESFIQQPVHCGTTAITQFGGNGGGKLELAQGGGLIGSSAELVDATRVLLG